MQSLPKEALRLPGFALLSTWPVHLGDSPARLNFFSRPRPVQSTRPDTLRPTVGLTGHAADRPAQQRDDGEIHLRVSAPFIDGECAQRRSATLSSRCSSR